MPPAPRAAAATAKKDTPVPEPTAYLYAVQDGTGRAVVEATLTTTTPDEVTVRLDESRVHLTVAGTVLATGYAPPETPLNLHRWAADDKLTQPVTRPVRPA